MLDSDHDAPSLLKRQRIDDEDPNSIPETPSLSTSKWQVLKRKLLDTLRTVLAVGKTSNEEFHSEDSSIDGHGHKHRSAWEGNKFAIVKMVVILVILFVGMGFMFSQHEGERHISYFEVTSNTTYIPLHVPLNVVRLDMHAAISEGIQNTTGMVIKDYSPPNNDEGDASSSSFYERHRRHQFNKRTAGHIGETPTEDIVYVMFNISVVLLGREHGDSSNVWDMVKPPQYHLISSDPLEKAVVDLHIEDELISTYNAIFYLGFKLEHINAPMGEDIPSDPYYGSQSESSSESTIYTPHILYSESPFVLDLELFFMPKAAEKEVLIGFIILIIVYGMIVFELYHRTLAAMLGSFMAVSALSYLQHRPTFHEIVDWVDFDTIGVLFGMMVMVGILSTTGVFEYCAVKAYKMSGGDIWKLTVLLCVFTGVASAFLDNVTTILLLAPVTIRLCEVINTSPITMLLLEVMFSNIGGTATPIGDPPNIIVVSDRKVQASGVADFLSFTVHILPGILISAAVCLWYTKAFVHEDDTRKAKSSSAATRHKELLIWKRTLAKIIDEGEEETQVREQLEEYISNLEAQIKEEDSKPAPSPEQFIADLEAKYPIQNVRLFKISAVVMGLVIAMFFLHSITHIPMVWVSILGFLIHLVSTEVEEIEKALEKVEFSTLLFFAALFILMRGLEELGLIEYIGETTASIVRGVPDSGNGRLTVAILLILWVSAIVSAFIDNIPFTTTMIPVVLKLSADLSLPLAPLLWSLVYGACLGGNGTLIGASANVVAAGLAEQSGFHISYMTFLRIGLPTMILSTFVCTIYLLITHVWWGWY